MYGLVSDAVRRIPRELSLTSASTLATLERTGPRRITDLAAIEGVTQPAMTVLVRVLEQSGLVERRGDPTDKRVALVAVTEAGADYVQARRRAGAAAFVQLIDKLPADEIAALGRGHPRSGAPAGARASKDGNRRADHPGASRGYRDDAAQERTVASPFHQPKGVWAVALACVVSFMGIGLVDPILPALSTQLKASPSQVELLFTSYLVVTAVAMLVTGWVSSRIGGKRTLVAGLVLIVAFSALAGASDTIGGIIGFRAGWGLGNALFIATSLAVIIGAASGGFSGAIILYETALGVGIALGPLVGGELGGISWRLPFFGVTALMSIALVATLLFVEPTPRPPRRTSILDPLKALRHRGLATMSLTALGYNWGFFTLLAFTPFVMHLGIHQLGYVFTGWGVMVAIFAVFVAPRAQARFGTPRTLYVTLALLALDLVVIAAFTSSQPTLIVAVIVSGAFVGLNNTLTTQAVMLVAPVEKPVASAAYGFVRFIGGGLAPYVASRLAADINVHVPFYLGAATVAAAIAVLATGHSLLTRAEQGPDVGAGPPPAPPATPTGRESRTGPLQPGHGGWT